MMRDWRLIGLQTLLAGALSTAPNLAGSIEVPPSEPVKEDPVARELREIKDSLTKLSGQLDKLRTEGDLANQKIQGDLNKLREDFQRVQGDLQTSRSDLVQLRQELDKLRERLAANRIAAYAPAPASTGRVRLVNTFSDPMTIIVNGKAYHLNPGDERITDPLPAGTFSYEVLGVQPPRDRLLAANETFTINVHPR